MAQGNLEFVRAFYEHFNRVGEPPWDQVAAHAEFDVTNVVGFGVYRGRDQVQAGIRQYLAVWDDWYIEPIEVTDAGDQVVAEVRDGGRLKETSEEVSNRFFDVFTLRSGKIVSWKAFREKAEAFRAAGLSE